VSSGPNAPTVFTSTAGGPTSAAIRSMSLASGVCGVGQLTADTAGEVKQSPLAPVDRHHKAGASGQGDRRRAAKLTACAGHNRYLCGHAFSLPSFARAPPWPAGS